MTRYNLYKDETPIETNEETPFDKAKKVRLEDEQRRERIEEINNTPPILRIIATSITIIAFMDLVVTLVWAYSKMSETIPEMIKIIKNHIR